MTKRKGISARAFMATLSTAGRDYTPVTPPGKPSQPQVLVIDRWDGQKWIEVRCEWNGSEYKEVK